MTLTNAPPQQGVAITEAAAQAGVDAVHGAITTSEARDVYVAVRAGTQATTSDVEQIAAQFRERYGELPFGPWESIVIAIDEAMRAATDEQEPMR